jgi:hypothetical protein
LQELKKLEEEILQFLAFLADDKEVLGAISGDNAAYVSYFMKSIGAREQELLEKCNVDARTQELESEVREAFARLARHSRN